MITKNTSKIVKGYEMNCVNSIVTHDILPKSNCLPEVLPLSVGKDSQFGVTTEILNTEQNWFALRATYGREKKAVEYLNSQGIECFYPTITRMKLVGDKKKPTTESRVPNIFFVYCSLDLIMGYVYDNVHEETKYLRFYYNNHHDGTKEPLIVPERQIRSFKIICNSSIDDTILVPNMVEKFKEGQHVVVTDGEFAGVEGIVARFCGQQRVGIVIEDMLTITTAYIPSAFLRKI